ncbi:formate dehydrogenase accessory protein FdhE [Pseudomonas cremoricolorata]|uniref:Protein FdhE homolog n=1 Tax=Pseudomonas cremoricolorata TaxID=157783 RepID=A0A089WQB4_9PSED|nr:formate dehydrogenase accessory protein FdhE [Pseudomonas cremoricolorata]AIR90771.1 formate dehydrogenase [Pseudomonas cremoricolorata]
MSSITLSAVEQPSGGVGDIAALLLPDLRQHYGRRAVRLRRLAEAHEHGAYLGFAAQVAEAQQALLDSLPLRAESVQPLLANFGHGAPLDVYRLKRSGYWQMALEYLLGQLDAQPDGALDEVIQGLLAMGPEQREVCAEHLLQGRYGQVESGQAVLLWAALMVYFTQIAAALPLSAQAAVGEQRQLCPVCSSAPVASVILSGKQAGLRYLHCGLCESRWHMVRVKCSNCEATGKLDYWSLDQHDSAVKAESCGDCDSYLKVMYSEHDPAVDPVADDLASLALDAELEQQGFARSSLNPFVFPG